MNTERDPRKLLEAALCEQIATGCPGAILEISAPSLSFNFSEAQGLFARNSTQQLRTNDAFRAASVTKAVTATTAVYLAANQHWNLDDSITDYLPTPVIRELCKLKGLGKGNELTIRRLLSHTSGLPDYFFDDRFQAQVRKDPNRIWQPVELIEAAVEGGELLFSPGTEFSYGDTAYVVVGVAIERMLKCSLADAYRSVIFEPLEMKATYLEWHETPPEHNLSHHYVGDEDLWGTNLSYDWAGGGLVTTASDLTSFLQGLFGETLFGRRWLKELMNWQVETQWRPNSSARYIRYGLGLGANIAYGEEIVGVTGVWSAFAYYWPAGDATITGTLNLMGGDRPALMDAVIRALKQLKPAFGR
jgi:D-alanyl-D-alanine carboxypeptidase